MIAQAVFSNSIIGRRSPGLTLALIICVLLLPTIVFPQTIQPTQPSNTVSTTAPAKLAVKAATSGPSWIELTPLQQQALKPLAVSWGTISEAQKRKWLEVSKNYPALSPADQKTLHSRMNEWVALSPQQRAEARLNFAKTRELSTQLTPEEKRAKWQTYQALSPEEKQQLASKAAPRPAGAALAVKPVAPQKLATIASQGVKPGANPASKNTVTPAVSSMPQAGPVVPAVPIAAPLN
ncbi:MAG: DUF3106 domain-containing protein [Polaromonas sp.]|nr:MAG: DUF3106 domain-containing protein [Polaromonas sp.]